MRSKEEILRFQRLIQTLIWAKNNSGKSSSEVVKVILQNYKGYFPDVRNGRHAKTS
jgi:hypothetical protein